AHGFRVATVIEQIVHQLECDAEVIAKGAQCFALLRARLGQGGGTQGRGVQEFNGGGQQTQVITAAAQCLAAQEHQQWTQAFATGGSNVVADFRDQRHARCQLLLDNVVDGCKVVRHSAVEGLGLHQRDV
nr:hypothetical protein [Tanacetum cinerariifolium]